MKFGLTEYESKCYLTLIKLGKATASELCRANGIPSSRIYGVLSSLQKKGYIKIEEDVPKKYIPINPEECIEKAFREKIRELEKAKERLKELRKFYKKEKAEIEIISGRKRILEAIKNILNCKEEIKLIVFRDDQVPLPKLSELVKNRKTRIIVGDKKFKRHFPNAKLNEGHFLHGIIVITEKAVLLTPPIPTQKKVAYVARNRDSVSLAEKTFEHLWEEAI